MTLAGSVTNGASGSGVLGLNVAGTGLISMTGSANNYSGGTTVSGGTLSVTCPDGLPGYAGGAYSAAMASHV